ncbi:TolC family protein [Cytophagales bacterium LB-30]|uniref:TolC family protein n=1 Tax=Shiella aurantiaca TaxID=3058365 RepID=A0ABT8F0G6_9BACT|nr:TolC family protein [Shiella aurantiaca]MDN4163935.1 TolC family protein [Shiella aurantiaca]
MKRVFLISTLWLLSVGYTQAQESVLQGYIQEGLQSNLQLQSEELRYQKSISGLQSARSLFLPQVTFKADYTLAGGGRKIEFPIGDLLNPVYSTLNELTGTNNFPQVRNEEIQFLPNNFHDTKFRIIQPLFNPEIYFNYKANKELISVQEAQKQAYAQELKLAISQAYFQYWQTEEGLKILAEAKLVLEEVAKLNRSLVANDKATQEVVLQTEYELAQLEKGKAELQRDNQALKAYFNFLLNRDLQSEILPESTALVLNDGPESAEALREQALSQRAEIKQAEAGLAANQTVLSLTNSKRYLPTLLAVGDVGYQGFGYEWKDQDYWLVQFSLSWDLFKGGEKKAKYQQARIDSEISANQVDQLKQQVELQVIRAYYELEAAEANYLSAQKGTQSSEKSFQLVEARYRNGQAILLEYLDAQNKVTTARLNENLARYTLMIQQAALNRTIANL